jgi:hypothetical protein
MTATQVFYRFLKDALTPYEFNFFNRLLRGEPSNINYYSKTFYRINYFRGIKSKTFVEDYLSKGRGRNLRGYMSNLMRYECQRIYYKSGSNYWYNHARYKPSWYRPHSERNISDYYHYTYVKLWHDYLDKHIKNSGDKIWHGETIDYIYE